MGLRPTKGDEDAVGKISWQAKAKRLPHLGAQGFTF